MKAAGRLALALGAGLLGGLLLGLVLLLGMTGVTGARILTVLSGSMTPAIRTGDAVVVRSVEPGELRVGDVVTFRDPADRSRLITHRLRRLRLQNGRIEATTRGDANTGVERWSAPPDGRVGVVTQRIPMLGFVLQWAQSAPGRLLLVVLPALLLGGFELRRIWRRPEPQRPRPGPVPRRPRPRPLV